MKTITAIASVVVEMRQTYRIGDGKNGTFVDGADFSGMKHSLVRFIGESYGCRVGLLKIVGEPKFETVVEESEWDKAIDAAAKLCETMSGEGLNDGKTFHFCANEILKLKKIESKS